MPRTGRPPVERKVVPCAACGKKLTRRVSDLARSTSGRVFCDRKCQDAVGSKPRRATPKPCPVCGTAVYSTPAVPRKYCSKQCHDTSQRVAQVDVNCASCGEAIPGLRPSEAATRRFCSKACEANGRIARRLDREHNGRPARVNESGYVLVWEPDHPRSKGYKGWMFEHRLVAEQTLGRLLDSTEEVHHINRDKADNRQENLAVLSGSDHGYITALDNWKDLHALKTLVERYRALYGDLPPE